MVSNGWTRNLLIAPEINPDKNENETIFSFQVISSVISIMNLIRKSRKIHLKN